MTESLPSESSTQEHAAAVREVFTLAGRSLLLYQRIEQDLKTLLPFVLPPGAEPKGDPWAELDSLSHSRETLGPLVDRLKHSIKTDDPEGFAAYLRAVLVNRNELVHTFVKLQFGSLATLDLCNDAILYLRKRHMFAVPFHRMVLDQLGSFVSLLDQMDEPDEAIH